VHALLAVPGGESARVASRRARSTPFSTTVAPAAASPSARLRPMLRLEPVTQGDAAGEVE
jgi:hypothetical protein